MDKLPEWMVRLIGFVLCSPMLLAMALADRFQKEKEEAPASPGLRPEEAERPALPQGYVESPRTYELRMAFVARAATPEEIQQSKNAKALRELMQNVGRN